MGSRAGRRHTTIGSRRAGLSSANLGGCSRVADQRVVRHVIAQSNTLVDKWTVARETERVVGKHRHVVPVAERSTIGAQGGAIRTGASRLMTSINIVLAANLAAS